MSETEHHGVVAMGQASFQERVGRWLDACFGPAIAADRQERCDRFIEEALEMVQATGYSADRAHALVEYVFSRPVGDPAQEAGGVQLTFASLCLANGLDMDACGETELARVWGKIDRIREKQAAKPTGSALPIAVAQPAQKASCDDTLLPESVTDEPSKATWKEAVTFLENAARNWRTFPKLSQADLEDVATALDKYCAKQHQRIAKFEAERQWQPIATAPRDKTNIFIAVPTKDRDDYIVGQAYFDPEPYDGAEEGEWWWANTAASNYFDSSINEGNWHPPTQWQPLPPAPLPVSPRAQS